jgi:hypothetical protein
LIPAGFLPPRCQQIAETPTHLVTRIGRATHRHFTSRNLTLRKRLRIACA